MNTSSLKSSITEMSVAEAENLISTLRQLRREYKKVAMVKKRNPAPKKKASKILPKLTEEQKLKLLEELRESLNGT